MSDLLQQAAAVIRLMKVVRGDTVNQLADEMIAKLEGTQPIQTASEPVSLGSMDDPIACPECATNWPGTHLNAASIILYGKCTGCVMEANGDYDSEKVSNLAKQLRGNHD